MVVPIVSMRKFPPGLRRSVSGPTPEPLTPSVQVLMLALSVMTVAAAHEATVVARRAAIQFHIRTAPPRNAAALRTRTRRQVRVHRKAATPILKEHADLVRDGLWN